jgi:hypothetical protein
MLYFIIGVMYAVFNGQVRKLDTGGDPMLPLAWVFLWPIGMLAHLTTGVKYLYCKATGHELDI